MERLGLLVRMEMWQDGIFQFIQKRYALFGNDYVIYSYSDWNLTTVIAYAIYGDPDGDVSTRTRYTQVKEEYALKIQKVLEGESQTYTREVHMIIVIVGYKLSDSNEPLRTPVFRVITRGENYIFVDIAGRVYKSWNEYLECNILPKCDMMYPTNGQYEANRDGRVHVSLKSAACSFRQRCLKVANAADMFAGAVATAESLKTLSASFPFSTSYDRFFSYCAIGVLGWYGACFSAKLFDRRKHKQSIGLEDAEARNCWVGIVTTSVFGLSIAGKHIARVGWVLYPRMQLGMKALQFFSTVLIGYNIYELIQREKQTALDDLRLTVSVMFFIGSVRGYMNTVIFPTPIVAPSPSDIENSMPFIRS